MSLKITTKAPDFRLKSQDGSEFHLSEQLKMGPVVLFFYPKAFTAGCTREVCSLRDDYSFFEERKIALFGISHDSVETIQAFGSKHRLPYTLLSDPNRKVCKLYEAVYPFGIMTRRISYYIESDGTIKGMIDDLIDSMGHVEYLKKRITGLSERNA
jgi:thioredoxin-dependent peroxiredoxin